MSTYKTVHRTIRYKVPRVNDGIDLEVENRLHPCPNRVNKVRHKARPLCPLVAAGGFSCEYNNSGVGSPSQDRQRQRAESVPAISSFNLVRQVY